MLTQERADILTKYLSTDADKAKELLAMDIAEALAAINGAGYDFSAEELDEYCKAFKDAVAQGANGDELSEDTLEGIAGGVVLTGAMVWGLVGCFAGGTAIGIAAGAKW